jgi:hypothetical protein
VAFWIRTGSIGLVAALYAAGTAAQTRVWNAPAFGHVFVVVEENADYARALNGDSMPYLDSLAHQYGTATQYYADSHPSIGNYFMLTVGDTVTRDDHYAMTVGEDNVVRELLKAHKTWRSYAEDLPQIGYTGPDHGLYARKHNTIALLSDVRDDSTQSQNVVPFTTFASDLANDRLPNYAFIVPNLCDDAHDEHRDPNCSLRAADAWLRTQMGPLIASPTFQHDGLLIITFDEADKDDARFGGGQIPWIVVSPRVKRGYRSTTRYQHESTLRLSLEALGVTGFPNQAATAPTMAEFFEP